MDDETGFAASVRLVVTALVSAAITATLVIGIGQAVLEDTVARTPSTAPLLVKTRH